MCLGVGGSAVAVRARGNPTNAGTGRGDQCATRQLHPLGMNFRVAPHLRNVQKRGLKNVWAGGEFAQLNLPLQGN